MTMMPAQAFLGRSQGRKNPRGGGVRPARSTRSTPPRFAPKGPAVPPPIPPSAQVAERHSPSGSRGQCRRRRRGITSRLG